MSRSSVPCHSLLEFCMGVLPRSYTLSRHVHGGPLVTGRCCTSNWYIDFLAAITRRMSPHKRRLPPIPFLGNVYIQSVFTVISIHKLLGMSHISFEMVLSFFNFNDLPYVGTLIREEKDGV
jgi:hypothetical protein